MIINVNVTQRHIDEGGRCTNNCPITLALLETGLWDSVQVNRGTIQLFKNNPVNYEYIDLQDKVKKWIGKYDFSPLTATPISFKLKSKVKWSK
jgi:hypothetical protein